MRQEQINNKALVNILIKLKKKKKKLETWNKP